MELDLNTLIEHRRHFHTNPELAFEETASAAYIEAALNKAGWDVRPRMGGTGVVATLKGKHAGRHILVRADMDALKVSDETTGDYRSRRSGVAHACGHDGHMAVMLGVAELLGSSRGEFMGAITCVFQPAEEILEGAKAMIDDGLLNLGPFDAILAFHLWNFLPSGTVGVRSGASHASVERVDIQVTGMGGHGGMPHLAVDAGAVLIEILGAIARLVPSAVSPIDSAVVTFGEFHAGSAYNVLPEVAGASGTLRALLPETHELLRSRIAEIVSSVANLHGAFGTATFGGAVPPVVSDPRITAILHDAAVSVVGEDRVVEHTPVMGGDDVSYLLEKVPGSYFVVGSQRQEGEPHPLHHHPGFDFEERALLIAGRVLMRALDRLLAP